MHRIIARLTLLLAAASCALMLSACAKRIAPTPADTSPPPAGHPGKEASKEDWREFSKKRGAELGKLSPGRGAVPKAGEPTGPPTGGPPGGAAKSGR